MARRLTSITIKTHKRKIKIKTSAKDNDLVTIIQDEATKKARSHSKRIEISVPPNNL